MRSRILAFIILIVLLGVPILSYWYFYKNQVSSIIFLLPDDSVPVSIHLRGTLGFSYLPIPDKIFEYQSICTSSCIFSPVPPLSYNVTLTASGMSTMEDDIAVSKNQKLKYSVQMEKTLSFQRIGKISPGNQELVKSLVESANLHLSGSFVSIAQIPSGKVYAMRSFRNKNEIGILTADVFRAFVDIPFSVMGIGLDFSRRFLVLERNAQDRFLVALDGSASIDFPYSGDIKIVDYTHATWKVLTSEGVFTYSSLGWEKNPRFSDYIDLSSQDRLGYISAHDTEKKSLQNIDDPLSFLILLDRKNAKIRTLEKGREIIGFIFYNGVPSYIDPSGDIWQINY